MSLPDRLKCTQIGNVVIPLRKLKIDVNVFTSKCLDVCAVACFAAVVLLLLFLLSLFGLLCSYVLSPPPPPLSSSSSTIHFRPAIFVVDVPVYICR